MANSAQTASAHDAKATADNVANAAKANADRMTDAGNQAFKQTIDKSLSAVADMNAQAKLNVEAALASATAAAKGAETLGSQAMAYVKKTHEDNTAALRNISSAKSLQEAVELQTTYVKSAMDAYLAEVNRWTETVSSSVRDSMRPINERATAVAQQIKSGH